MTTLDHRLPVTAPVPRIGEDGRARGALAAVAENAYLRLLVAVLVIAAGAAALVVGIIGLLDLVVPLVFGDELRALATLFPQVR